MNSEQFISQRVALAIESLYGATDCQQMIQIQPTRKEFEGDLTVVVFPLLRISKKSPEITAQEIGEAIKASTPEVSSFNVIKGFLNIKLSPLYWSSVINGINDDENFGQSPATGKRVMVEFSSPNTNNPSIWDISEITY